jgi:4-cresol dehydrogenase (hydroxylating)
MAVPSNADPDADRCGLLWCSPVAPNTGAAVSEVAELATSIALKHGFEPIISVSLLNERMTITTVALTYDREVAGEDQRAMTCYESLTREFIARGYPPYRLNVASMSDACFEGPYRDALASIKSALDPNRILGPGRYE